VAVPRTARQEVHDAAPALGWYTDNLLYHQVWNRQGLPTRDRSLVTLAALIAHGRTAQLKSHIRRALVNGLRPAEIAELLTHLAFFTGWPSAMSALPMMTEVFDTAGVDTGEIRQATIPAGTPDTAVDGSDGDGQAGAGPFASVLHMALPAPVIDELWRRDGLSARDRSLVTVASLVALGERDDLARYAQRALHDGVELTELCESVAHLAFYVGSARAAAAAAELDESLATAGYAAQTTSTYHIDTTDGTHGHSSKD
jgi:4-carboxymuconolactone decarboxylase